MRYRPTVSSRSNRTMALIAAAATILAVISFSSVATAGVGIFAEYGRNMPTSGGTIALGAVEVPNPGLFTSNDITVGVAFDSNLARNSLINNRVDFGFHVALPTGNTVLGLPIAPTTAGLIGNGYGGQLSYALGFGIVRSEAVRVWLGPDVRFNVDYYGSNFGGSVSDFVDVQLGAGARLGINLHTGDSGSVSLTGGYNYKWGWLAFPNAINLGATSHRDHVVTVGLAYFWRGGSDVFE